MRPEPVKRFPSELHLTLGLFFGFLLLYAATLAPGVVGGDPGEHQFVPYILGIPHRTGYPLFVLVGKLWTLIFPAGSIAYRMNFLSATFAAATVGMMYPILRELGGKREAALLSGVVLGLSQLFWELGTVAGVRTLNTFFFLAIVWLALGWRRTAHLPSQARRTLSLLAVTSGLSLAHHRTVIFLLPVLLLYLVTVKWPFWSSGKELAKFVALGLAPLALYLYLPIRTTMNPPYIWERADNLAGFLDLVVAHSSGWRLRALSRADLPLRLADFANLIVRQITPVGCALALLGGLALARRDLRNFLLIALPLVGVSALTIAWFASPEKVKPVFVLPALPLYALFVGAGISFLLEFAKGRAGPGRGAWALGLVSISLLFYTAYREGYLNLRGIVAKRRARLDNFRQELRGQNAEGFALASLNWAEDGAVLLCDWEQATPLLYYQLVDGKRQDLIVHWPIDAWQEWLVRAQAEGRKAYLARALPEAKRQRYLTNAGPMVELRSGPQLELPSSLTLTKVRLEDKLELTAYILLRVDGSALPPGSGLPRGGVLCILLYWQALPGLDKDYSTSLRLVSQQGKTVAQTDGRHPVLGLYPTSLWSTGELVADYYELPLARTLQPGHYRLEVLAYRTLGPGQWENLQVSRARPATDRVRLASLEIK